MAEEVGFEPTVPVTRDGGFQDRCLKPLDHSSGWTIIQPEERKVNFDRHCMKKNDPSFVAVSFSEI
jgi:hypothetical protein